MLLFAILLLVGCESKDEITTPVVLKSQITMDDLDNMHFTMKSILENDSNATRSEDLFNDTLKCKMIINPLIEDGKNIQSQLIRQKGKMSADELEFFESMDENELAILSLLTIYTSTENLSAQTRSVDMGRLTSCLGVAIGLSAISELRVGGVISAKTVGRAVMAIAKRYAGYIGVALMVYDFYDCFY